MPIAQVQPPWAMVQDVRQDAAGFTKHWLVHPKADLFVWADDRGEVASFQLCVRTPDTDAEHMAAWDRDSPQLTLGTVDSGESSPLANRSPVLRQTPTSPAAGLVGAAWPALRWGLPPALVSAVDVGLGLANPP